MPANPNDQVDILIEAAIRHEQVLAELAGAMKSTAASVAALTALMKRERPDRSQGNGRREAVPPMMPPSRQWPEVPDPGSSSVEHQALLAHYDQLRSSLGRDRAHFYVRVLHGLWDLDGDGDPDARLLALAGQAASLANRIQVGGITTSVAAEWRAVQQADGESLLICLRQDVGQVEYGTEVQCYAGTRLVGVGVWPPRSFEAVRDYAIEMG